MYMMVLKYSITWFLFFYPLYKERVGYIVCVCVCVGLLLSANEIFAALFDPRGKLSDQREVAQTR